MARVTRHSAQGQIPVQQAQLIDPSGFRADTSSAEALKVAGKAVGELGIKLEEERKVKEELAKRKRASQDRIGITNVNAIMDDAEREYTKQIIGKPLTEHAAIRTKITANARARANQADLSPEAREIAKANTDIRMEKFADEAELANIVATNNDALIKTSEAYETALVESDIDTIAEAEGLLDAELENMEPAEAAKYKADLEERAVKAMEKKAMDVQMDKAALNPLQMTNDDRTGSVDKELESRKKGNEPSQEFAFLSNSDLEAVRDYANSVGEKAKSDSAIAAASFLKESHKKIVSGDTDITTMVNEALADETMSEEDKIAISKDIPQFFNLWNSATKEDGKVIVTSDSTRIKALRIINAVKTGRMSVDAGLNVYQSVSKVEGINGTDGKGFINDIFAAGESAQKVESIRQSEILGEREKRLRDAIEKQPNFFGDDAAAEILKDFANTAVIRLNDAFRDGEFDQKQLDAQVDNLIKKYTLSEAQQLNASNARSLRLAKTLKQQQDSITKLVSRLKADGKDIEAKEIMDEAISLGIFTISGDTIQKGKGDKKNIGVEVLKRILDSL